MFIATHAFATKSVANEITPVVGYRQDSLKWKTKGGASGKWKNLNFIDYGLKGKTTLSDTYVINYDVTVSNLLSGTYHDNHYLNPAQTSNTPGEKFSSIAVRPNLGLGYKFKPTKYFQLIPQVGFLYDILYLKTKTSNTGAISAFKNTIQWYGPWFGIDTTTKLTKRWTMNVAAAYQLTFYNGSGNWQLPPSQRNNTLHQSATTGQGVTGRFRLQYEVVKSVSIGGEADLAWKQVKSGNDSRSFAAGGTVKDKLSKVSAHSYGARAVLTKTF
jgi:hypothetical protein